MSKMIAKWTTGAKVIESPRNATEAWLLETVRRQAQAAGIGMPEVAVYDGPEMNAFATGASKNKSLVAVSTGLLNQMERAEVEAVLGHEVSHIANGDMVTLVLFGIFLIMSPGAGILSLLWLVSIYAIAFGVMLIVLGFRVRNMPDTTDSQPRAPQAA
jgi:Zn-dependent protease with chaperone function